MAIDSAQKRKSISGIFGGLPGVTPDATPDSAWRQSAGWSYAGIAAGAPVSLAPAPIPVAGGIPFITFTYIDSITVALPAYREWVLPSSGDAGTARVFVPYLSDAASASYIDPDGGSRITIRDQFGSGDWSGYISSVSYRGDGVELVAQQNWAILNRRPVAPNATFDTVTAADLVEEAISATPFSIGGVAQGPPAIESFTFHGERVWDVVREMIDRSGMEFYIGDDGLAYFGPKGSLYPGVFLAGGNLQDVQFGIDASQQVGQITAISGDRVHTVGEVTDAGNWPLHEVLKVDVESSEELNDLAEEAFGDQRYVEETVAGTVNANYWDLREGDWIQMHHPNVKFSGITRMLRVVRRAITESNDRMVLGLIVERHSSPGDVNPPAYSGRPRRERKRDVLRRLREMEREQWRGRKYLSDREFESLRKRVSKLE